MKKSGVLNQELSALIASMGHTDMVTICDSGLPIPLEVNRIDLSVSPGIPSFVDVLTAVVGELEIEKVILANELNERNPDLVKSINKLFPSAKIEFVSHESFKEISHRSKAIVRSGEITPYANIILVSGVIF